MTPEPSEREQQIEQADIITRVANGSLLLKLNDPEGTRSALLAGASALRSSAGLAWQPIATAPKDGKRILTPRGISYWSLLGRCWNREGDAEAYAFGGPECWMPLPDPPAALLASAQDGEK